MEERDRQRKKTKKENNVNEKRGKGDRRKELGVEGEKRMKNKRKKTIGKQKSVKTEKRKTDTVK